MALRVVKIDPTDGRTSICGVHFVGGVAEGVSDEFYVRLSEDNRIRVEVMDRAVEGSSPVVEVVKGLESEKEILECKRCGKQYKDVKWYREHVAKCTK